MNTDALACPHEDCDDTLRVTWAASYDLDAADIGPLRPGDLDITWAHAQTWQVECLAGHAILLPGPLYCPCPEDTDHASCPHDQDDYDSSDDWRTFRTHDRDRLQRVIAHLGGTS